ncbi:hypothetical protein C819_03907 [Lachnospiraceae bacterium 10-1]|jgi:flagellar FliL protein|nr:hypothetical protein C819_03907 [Lachnospiraceae bacterium 10-1]
MKKNLISIVILALLVVNLVLTAIMMFGVMSTNKKTAALVGKIASAISLDLGESGEGGEAAKEISIADTVTYTISDMTIPLKKSEPTEDGEVDDKDHYALISVTICMDSTSKDYKTYGEEIATREDLIKGQINDVVSQFTIEDIKMNSQLVKDEILKKVQELFNSDFIFDVTLPKENYQ